MTPEERITRLRPMLRHRRWLLENSLSDSRIFAELRAGVLTKIRRGWYVQTREFTRLAPEERHLLAVMASAGNPEPPHPGTRRSRLPRPPAPGSSAPGSSAPGPPAPRPAAPKARAQGALTIGVYSHHSAAALHGLPLHGLRDEPVHITLPRPQQTKSNAGVRRHTGALPVHSITQVGAFPCTSLQRTVLDIGRVAKPETAIAAADAALRLLAPQRQVPTSESPARLLEAFEDLPASRNLSRARRVIELADARAESPLESISRLYLHRLGFEVDLQVPVPSPSGGTYRVDIELVGLGILCEVDGKSKYGDGGQDAPAMRELLYREKRRHDWIVGFTEKRMLRWGYAELRTIELFAGYLRAMGVPIPNEGALYR